MYRHFGQHHAKDRMLRPSTRQLTSAAIAGHHMIAVIIMPNAMPRRPDQMMSDQMTALNSSVNKK